MDTSRPISRPLVQSSIKGHRNSVAIAALRVKETTREITEGGLKFRQVLAESEPESKIGKICGERSRTDRTWFENV
jgi:hypothetical protein